jgi:predicted phage tail protein
MIKNIYILKKDNSPFIIYKNGHENNVFQQSIARLSEALRSLAIDIKDELCHFQLGNEKYHYSVDKMSGTKFIIVTDTETKDKHINSILREIKNSYINEFIGSSLMSEVEIKQAKRKVKKEMSSHIDDEGLKTEDFLLNLN